MLHKLQGLREVAVSRGKDLRGLSVVGGKQLKKVVLKGVASLEQLTIADCSSLEVVEGLDEVSTRLQGVALSGCPVTEVCSQHCVTRTIHLGRVTKSFHMYVYVCSQWSVAPLSPCSSSPVIILSAASGTCAGASYLHCLSRTHHLCVFWTAQRDFEGLPLPLDRQLYSSGSGS
jgi:hypothetical protein